MRVKSDFHQPWVQDTDGLARHSPPSAGQRVARWTCSVARHGHLADDHASLRGDAAGLLVTMRPSGRSAAHLGRSSGSHESEAWPGPARGSVSLRGS
jgi:hypothetical protein